MAHPAERGVETASELADADAAPEVIARAGHVVLRDGHAATGPELVEHVPTSLARYKAPDTVEFVAELPKTSTGKIQKFQLRERERAGREGRVQG